MNNSTVRIIATVLLALLVGSVLENATLRGESPDSAWRVRAVPVGRRTMARGELDDRPIDVSSPSQDESAPDENETPRGVSPYADWTDRGMRASVDVAAAREDLSASQMRWINGAYGGQPYRAAEHHCAGCPQCVRRLATCSDTGHYLGYQVGGGTVFRGTGRFLDEGTFGWDYRGLIFPPRVMLGWSHHRYQGGTGAYATDRRGREDRAN